MIDFETIYGRVTDSYSAVLLSDRFRAALQSLAATGMYSYTLPAGVTSDEVDALIAEGIRDLGQNNMIGSVAAFMEILPPGWLLCDGSLVWASEYPALLAVCPSLQEGSGLRLPNLVDRYLIGTAVSPAGQADGSFDVTLQDRHIPPHTHAATVRYAASPGGTSPAGLFWSETVEDSYGSPDSGNMANGAVQIGSAGAGDSFVVKPPSLAVRWAICAR